MYFQKKKITAEYKEKIEHQDAEDTDNIEDNFNEGLIPFQLEEVKNVTKRIEFSGIERNVNEIQLITNADLPFKSGDAIRLNNLDWYTISNVSRKIRKGYETVVAMNNSLASRYEEKVITLDDFK